jgi:predicted nucleotide-binding protein
MLQELATVDELAKRTGYEDAGRPLAALDRWRETTARGLIVLGLGNEVNRCLRIRYVGTRDPAIDILAMIRAHTGLLADLRRAVERDPSLISPGASPPDPASTEAERAIVRALYRAETDDPATLPRLRDIIREELVLGDDDEALKVALRMQAKGLLRDYTNGFVSGRLSYEGRALAASAVNAAKEDGHMSVEAPSVADTRNVFVVHGRDDTARDAMFAFLRSVDLNPIEWEEARHLTKKPTPYVGEILDAGFAHARAVVVLLTGDDEARLIERLRNASEPAYETGLTAQARPNVLFEAGMALGRHPDRTILIEIGELRPFSDIAGRHTVRLTTGGAGERTAIVERLRDAGCVVKTQGKRDWLDQDFFAGLVRK